MKATVAFLVLAVFPSCSIGESDSASLEVQVRQGTSSGVLWPGRLGQFLTIDNSLYDPADMAGIEAEITGIGQRVVFDAEDFKAGIPPFGVPDSGWMNIVTHLRQDGEIVAQGVSRWRLEPKVRWRAEYERRPDPSDSGPLVRPRGGPDEGQICGVTWCYSAWRFEIREDARNYDVEALWLTLWRVHPDECLDVC